MKPYEMILKDYNEKWRAYIALIPDNHEYKLEYLVSVSEETKTILEGLEFSYGGLQRVKSIDGQFYNHFQPNDRVGEMYCCSNGNKYNIEVMTEGDELTFFDFYGYQDNDYLTPTIVFTNEEINIIQRYMEEFGILKMFHEATNSTDIDFNGISKEEFDSWLW